MIKQVESYLLKLQHRIINQISAIDTKDFIVDDWQKDNIEAMNGYGKTCVLKNGDIFESAGVNFSFVSGDSLPLAATANRAEFAHKPWSAVGVSLVIHPKNPFVPTSHMNVRFFTSKDNNSNAWWFGGGYDLTPYYGFDEDCIHWHTQAKHACDSFDPLAYKKYKKWCDNYFYLKHRKEPRGIGGIFFDDVSSDNFAQCFSFLQSVGNSFSNAYFPIVNKRKQTKYEKKHRAFQLYRRGRYVEFNLIYDRGTIFGLQSGGRSESILMSMPPMLSFEYNRRIMDKEEQKLYDYYLQNKDWIELE